MLGVENQEQEISTVEFGDKTRLLRVYAWVDNLKASVRDEPRRLEEQLGVQELEKAEISIIKSIQRVVFEKEITHITSQAKRDCPLLVNQLSLFLDEKGLLRCKSRLNNASISDSSKTPILLPSRHYYSDLVIRESHERVFHNGVKDTLNLVREKYWILRGREAAKRMIRRCVVCRKYEGIPFKFNVTPDFPDIRVDNAPPFTHTGIDFAGPLLTKGLYCRGSSA